VRRLGPKVGFTPLPRSVWQGSFAQPPDGPVWFATGKMGDPAIVWVDVSPNGDEPAMYPRPEWRGVAVPGMGPASQLAVGPGNRMYLLHEGGCSLLRLSKLEFGQRPKLPVRRVRLAPFGAPRYPTTPRGPATTRAAMSPATVPTTRPAALGEATDDLWQIEEVARREWPAPRNQFGRVAFDETGVWVLPEKGPLIRTPLPKE
jgi:hypothetical protein